MDVWDLPEVDLAAHFPAVIEFVKAALAGSTAEKAAKVLVHCRAGISRSATLVMAYLMESRAVDSLELAVRRVLDERPYVCPNVSFRQQLRDYEQALFQKSSFADDHSFLQFLSAFSQTWSGTESDHDRIPILAGRNTSGKPVYTMDDAYPGAAEGDGGTAEKAAVKPKKAFLKRGQGKKATSVKASSATAAASAEEGAATDAPTGESAESGAAVDLTVAGVSVETAASEPAAAETVVVAAAEEDGQAE